MRDLLVTAFGPGVICPVCGSGPGDDWENAWFCYGAQFGHSSGKLMTRCERCRANFSLDLDDATCELVHQPQRAKVGGVMMTVLQWRIDDGDEKDTEGTPGTSQAKAQS